MWAYVPLGGAQLSFRLRTRCETCITGARFSLLHSLGTVYPIGAPFAKG
jgi:hypothetical protein